MMKKHHALALVIAAVFVALSYFLNIQIKTSSTPPSESLSVLSQRTLDQLAASSSALYPIVRVVDGDTVIVRIEDSNVTARLIGIDTPEVVDPRKPVECFGMQASDEAKKVLNGQEVALQTDSTQDTYDKYGRLLVYVFLSDGTLFNKMMIAEGYAHEYTYDLPYRYQKEFKAAESSARTNERGLWSPNTCNGNTGTNSSPTSATP